MKRMKRLLIAFVTICILLTLVPPVQTQAATVRLNKTSVTLTKGKYKTLKLYHAVGKIRWSTSNKSVVTVTDGRIHAVGIGRATITAKNKGVKYTCEVRSVGTVKENLSALRLYIKKHGVKTADGYCISIYEETTEDPAKSCCYAIYYLPTSKTFKFQYTKGAFGVSFELSSTALTKKTTVKVIYACAGKEYIGKATIQCMSYDKNSKLSFIKDGSRNLTTGKITKMNQITHKAMNSFEKLMDASGLGMYDIGFRHYR